MNCYILLYLQGFSVTYSWENSYVVVYIYNVFVLINKIIVKNNNR